MKLTKQPLTYFFLSVFGFENVFGGEHQTINLAFLLEK